MLVKKWYWIVTILGIGVVVLLLMIDEIYSRLAAKGKAYGFESIPCVFVSSDMVDTRCPPWTLPPGSPHREILLQSSGLNSSILGYPVY